MLPNPNADPRDQLMPRDKAELLAKLAALMSDFMYVSDVEEALVMIDILCRHSYVEGYNRAAKQFGVEREFFKEDLK